jgi:hypothetical protein
MCKGALAAGLMCRSPDCLLVRCNAALQKLIDRKMEKLKVHEK